MSFKKNKIHLPKMELEVINSSKPAFTLTKGRDVGIHQTWKVELDASAFSGNTCPAPMTRAALLTLRSAGALDINCTYVITDHVQGRLVAGTTITLHADSATELSENVTINTTYDNEGWRGIYDIDRSLVLELEDNRKNLASGLNGNEVANFDWGNTAYYGNKIINSTFTVTYGATAPVFENDIRNATVNLTGFTGSFYWNRVHTAANWNLTNANGFWRYNEYKNGGSFNLTGYTGGGDSYYNEFDGVSFNFVGQTGSITLRQNEIVSSSWTVAGTNAFTVTLSTFQNQTITRPASGGLINLNSCASREPGSISVTDTGSLSMTGTQNNGSVTVQSTGTLTVNYSRLEQSCAVRNSGTATMLVQRTTFEGSASSAYTDTGSSTVMNVTDCTVQSSGLIRVVGAVGGGAFNVSNTRVASGSFIYKRNTGSLTVANGEIIGASGLDAQSGDRSYIFNRPSLSEVARATMTGTGAFTDTMNELILQNRGTLSISCSGASNTLNYNSVSGLSGQITLSGTTGGQIIQRTHCQDAALTISNCTVSMTHDLNNLNQAGNLTISNLTVSKPVTYCNTHNGVITVTGTVAGAITRVNVRANGAVNISGTTGTVTSVDCSEGIVTINGGATHVNITKMMSSTLTTGNFTSNNVIHISNINKTYTANNTGRSDYLGVTSTTPIV